MEIMIKIHIKVSIINTGHIFKTSELFSIKACLKISNGKENLTFYRWLFFLWILNLFIIWKCLFFLILFGLVLLDLFLNLTHSAGFKLFLRDLRIELFQQGKQRLGSFLVFKTVRQAHRCHNNIVMLRAGTDSPSQLENTNWLSLTFAVCFWWQYKCCYTTGLILRDRSLCEKSHSSTLHLGVSLKVDTCLLTDELLIVAAYDDAFARSYRSLVKIELNRFKLSASLLAFLG